MIDTSFDVYSDTPPGKDPDSHSPTLREFHRQLWSKPLPNGATFDLVDDRAGTYLYHNSAAGEFHLSSDSLGHTYSRWDTMKPITTLVPDNEMGEFFRLCSTIGAFTLFPSKKIDRRPTINGHRGMSHKIKDRFDLTLECIRRHYAGEESPLSATLGRYSPFFDLFENFHGYVEFFLFQDLLADNDGGITFWLPCENFGRNPVPENVEEYRIYMGKVSEFIHGRNRRMQQAARDA